MIYANDNAPTELPPETPLQLTEHCKRKYIFILFVFIYGLHIVYIYIVIDILCNAAGRRLMAVRWGALYEKQ